MLVTVLGSGGSAGVPNITGDWGNCDSKNSKNKRTRSSLLLETNNKRYLVDTSPDIRAQLLSIGGVNSLDGVIYTHAHADHLHGIDDLRAINRAMNAPINIYADQHTLEQIYKRFNYTIQPLPKNARGYFKPTLVPNEIQAGQVLEIEELKIKTFDQDHGFSRTIGMRIGNFAYSTDVVELPEDSFNCLTGIHTWLLGVFSKKEHPTHIHLEKAMKWIDRVKPKRVFLTHLSSDFDYFALKKYLPSHIEPAFDGLKIKCT